jgi:hypothetical protein
MARKKESEGKGAGVPISLQVCTSADLTSLGLLLTDLQPPIVSQASDHAKHIGLLGTFTIETIAICILRGIIKQNPQKN